MLLFTAYTFIHQQGKKATESNQVSMCTTMARLKNLETNLGNQNSFT
jgi:hypothetical protein